jgi:toxin-antitoxin system PIN domain toxin
LTTHTAASHPGVALLDVSVLVALAWPNHVHHEVVRAWFRRNHRGGWATCSMTQTGFVHVSANTAFIPTAVSPREAVLLLAELTGLTGHRFWADDLQFVRSAHVDTDRLVGHRQVTDAHLLGLALRHNGRFATLDGKLRSLLPDGAPASSIELVRAHG